MSEEQEVELEAADLSPEEQKKAEICECLDGLEGYTFNPADKCYYPPDSTPANRTRIFFDEKSLRLQKRVLPTKKQVEAGAHPKKRLWKVIETAAYQNVVVNQDGIQFGKQKEG